MSAANNRASLLSGLRTVRSGSGPTVPHTAALGGSFQQSPPRFANTHHQATVFDDDYAPQYAAPPLTAALDGRAPRFQQQQQQFMPQSQMGAFGGMQGAFDPSQAQFLQLQLMQAMMAQQQQAQKLQAEIALQQQVAAMAYAAQRQQQQQQQQQQQNPPRVASNPSRVPSTAGPTQASFDIRSNAISQIRSGRMAGYDESVETGPVPMTAAIGGRFAGRSQSTNLNPNAPTFKLGGEADQTPVSTPVPPATPASSSTVVISGGVSLGGLNTPSTPVAPTAPSKSDSAISWRRGSNAANTQTPRNVSPPKLNGRLSPPRKASPEQNDKQQASGNTSAPKYRPQPLRFKEVESPIPSVMIEDEDGRAIYSSGRVPVNPPSPSSSSSSIEAPRRYEGLGIGRPTPSVPQTATFARACQPLRQPRGPPAGAEDLGTRNFAARVKRGASTPMIIKAQSAFVEAY